MVLPIESPKNTSVYHNFNAFKDTSRLYDNMGGQIMPIWFCLIWGFTSSILLWFVEIAWLQIFKIDIPMPVVLASIPILWIAAIVFWLFATDRVLRIGFVIEVSLVFLTISVRQIMKLIEKSKE